jgi:hypothetical protein
MKIFRKIKLFFRPMFECGKTPLQIEIDRVQSALNKYKQEVWEMDERWAQENGVCCPGCAYGTYYSNLCDKIDRVSEQLDRLKSKSR